jgi:hypothetical protein
MTDQHIIALFHLVFNGNELSRQSGGTSKNTYSSLEPKISDVYLDWRMSQQVCITDFKLELIKYETYYSAWSNELVHFRRNEFLTEIHLKWKTINST